VKLTKKRLKEIIKEEIQQLNEASNSKIVDDISDMVDDYGEFSKKLNMINPNSLGSKFTTNLSATFEFSDSSDPGWDKEVKELKSLLSKVKEEMLKVNQQRIKKIQQNIKNLDILFKKLK
jgi:DNA-binding transcriptional regulator GbsR (MarR family)